MKHEFHWTMLRNSLHNTIHSTELYSWQILVMSRSHLIMKSTTVPSYQMIKTLHISCLGHHNTIPANDRQSQLHVPSETGLSQVYHTSQNERKNSLSSSCSWDQHTKSSFTPALATIWLRAARENIYSVAPHHPAWPSGPTPSWFTSLLPVNQTPELPLHLSSQTFCISITVTYFPNQPLPPKPLHSIPLSIINKQSCYGLNCVPPTFTQIYTLAF